MPKNVSEFESDAELARCYTSALRILNYRWNSEAELRRKLASKRFEADHIESTLARLKAEKWLDDKRFAEAFVRTRAGKRMGRMRIRGELRNAGVSGAEAEDAIRDHLDPEKEAAGLKVACDKRARALARRHGPAFLTTEEGRNKLTAYLLKQGYDNALVRSAVADLQKEIKVADDQPNP